MTNEEIFKEFERKFSYEDVEDYRPANVNLGDRVGITVYLTSGDIIKYFPASFDGKVKNEKSSESAGKTVQTNRDWLNSLPNDLFVFAINGIWKTAEYYMDPCEFIKLWLDGEREPWRNEIGKVGEQK